MREKKLCNSFIKCFMLLLYIVQREDADLRVLIQDGREAPYKPNIIQINSFLR